MVDSLKKMHYFRNVTPPMNTYAFEVAKMLTTEEGFRITTHWAPKQKPGVTAASKRKKEIKILGAWTPWPATRR